ncbi:MAG: multicopper oxidase type 3 [Gammaproteobacteria bacterium]|nr:multicopper oxidase type 3 [Gammaproteobacteria bacterium]
MHNSNKKLGLHTASLAMALLAATGVGAAATNVSLTAQRATATMTDGTQVPMWAYCGSADSGSAGKTVGGTCPLPPIAGTSAVVPPWTPGPTIIVPSSDSLVIKLTNTLPVATSLTILGQLGGGLGTPTPDPVGPIIHKDATATTWPVTAPGTFKPPTQGVRARSFVPEAASGTSGNSQTYTFTKLKPGTYLYETATHPSLQAPMGLYGVLIVTQAPVTGGTPAAITTAGTAFPAGAVNGVPVDALAYDSDATFLISEVDAVQNAAVDGAAVAGTSDRLAWNDATCVPNCYPPAVNYAPTYLLLNGQGFDRNNPGGNAAQVSPLYKTGNVMVRVVNAGLRTHVPSLVGLPLALIAEDGNREPGAPKIQSELLMPAGKTRDVLVTPGNTGTAYSAAAYGFFDRALGLSSHGQPNGGAQGYLAIVDPATGGSSKTFNTWLGGTAGKAAAVTAQPVPDAFTVPKYVKTYSNNVLTNDIGIYSAAVSVPPTKGVVTLKTDGSFVYTAGPTFTTDGPDSFTYCGNGDPSLCASVTLTAGAGVVSLSTTADSYTSRVATVFRTMTGEGVLANDFDTQGFPLTAALDPAKAPSGCAVVLNLDGSFLATNGSSAGGTCTFNYFATDSQGTKSSSTLVTVNFQAGSQLAVTVRDALGITQNATQVASATAASTTVLDDYMWLIEEDPTFHTVPGVTLANGPDGNPGRSLSNSLHVSHSPIVAAGCTGPLSCGDAQSYGGIARTPAPRSLPFDVALDSTKHYFISVLPGDAGNAFINAVSGDPTVAGNCTFSNTGPVAATDCGHTLGGANVAPPVAAAGPWPAVTVLVDPNPLKPAQLAIIVFEDNNPTNGDVDDAEPGLGGFNIIINDAAGRSGDPAGQITYDAFNMPLTNGLIGKPGCPNEENPTVQRDKALTQAEQNSLVGAIYTCPDGHRNISNITVTGAGAIRTVRITTTTPHGFAVGTAVDLSGVADSLHAALNGSFAVFRVISSTVFDIRTAVPGGQVTVGKAASARDPVRYQLAGHALVKNIMPGRFDILAHPSAARQGNNETWWQVSTLEGTPANDAFTRAGEPAYFQEFGPPGYHAFIGFISPDRIAAVNTVMAGSNTVKGRVTNVHMSRPSAIFNYDSGSREPLSATACFVSLNTSSGNGANAGFAQCDAEGNFKLTGIPGGNHQVVVWDQWLDQIIAYFSVNVPSAAAQVPGTPNPPAPGGETGNEGPVPVSSVAGVTVDMGDLPVFSWFTRVDENAFVYVDATCPQNAIAASTDQASLKAALATCPTAPLAQIPITIRYRNGSISNVLQTDSNGNATFNELFPLFNWYVAEVDQTRYAPLTARVVVDGGGKPDCTSTTSNASDGTFTTAVNTPCDSPAPGVLTSTYPDGTPTEKTYTAGELYFGLQGFISETAKIDWGKTMLPPGQNGGFSGLVVYTSTRGFDDPSLEVQFKWEPLVPRVPVNLYEKVTATDGSTSLRLVAQTFTTSFDDVAAGLQDAQHNPLVIPKMNCPGQVGDDPYVPQVLGTDLGRCYDGFHNWNQVQPQTYDGYYQFATIYPSGIYADGTPVVPTESQVAVPNGAYVIEVVPPAGYEIVKEEDKNILIGDAWVAPPAQQFAGLGNIFILPDQATVASAYNLNGATAVDSRLGFADGKVQFPLCAGSPHRVPDYLSLFPNSAQVAPFAGADRPLCDRKEVTITAGQNGGANFFLFSNTPRAAEFTGIILDDASAEFNVAAPDFGEKFSVPYVPVSIKDGYGVEIERIYSDQWGGYNGMTPSSWQVNVPNPAGYSPNMLITCINDPGPLQNATGGSAVDPQYMPTYSNFCYTNPFMPGLTTYLDTPVLPVAAFASNYVAGYNPVDCAYPDATPAISRVDGDGVGPWISPSGSRKLRIKALGTIQVPNPAYLGPSASADPYNTKTVSRTYSFAGGQGIVTLNGNPVMSGVTWGDDVIEVTLPGTVASGSYELGITNANGKQSVDTVTVTIESAKPTVVQAPGNSVTTAGLAHPIQDAIDSAKPGDLIILDAGIYNELVVMWKPVRLQGVGAASVTINAAKYPTHKLELWRPEINQLFGIDTISGNQVPNLNSQVDPLPGQEITGGIVILEPSVLATEEGAGITVLAKDPTAAGAGCNSKQTSSYWDSTQVVNNRDGTQQGVVKNNWRRMGESNFTCASSRIDGITVTGGDAGGGIYVNGYAHGLEIANNRVYGNAGAFAGGIRVGVPHLEEQDLTLIQAGFNNGVNIHHNSITQNGMVEAPATIGGTQSGAGAGAGLSLCTGTNNYSANYNFICGNYSSGDGGGIGHLGWSSNGTIKHNTIIFNQAYFQQASTSGGGIAIEGEPPAAGGLSLGIGSVNVDSNLIQGNYAESGHGGGVALIQVNGSDRTCPRNGPCTFANHATLTNNMIVDNVAGWSGGGISLADSINVAIVNNTISMNDSVGIAGPLFNNPTHGKPSPAGVASQLTTAALVQQGAPSFSSPTLTNNVIWHNRSFFANFYGTINQPNNGRELGVSGPYYSNAQLCASNSSADASPAVIQSCATLTTALNSSKTALQSLGTGACDAANERYWDLGVLQADNVPVSATNPGPLALAPKYSILSDTTAYGGSNNKAADPNFVHPYCNGSQTISASADESGNFVDLRYGPLTQTAPIAYTGTAAKQSFADYHLADTTSPAWEAATASGAPDHDFFDTKRPQGGAFDIGAHELPGPPVPKVSFAPAALVFPNTAVNRASSARLVTLSNTGNGVLQLQNVLLTGPYARGTGANAGTCGATVNAAASCTIGVVFTPVALGAAPGTLAITSNDPTAPTINLSGTGTQGRLTFTSLTGGLSGNSWTVGATTGTRTLLVTNVATGATAGPVTLSATVALSGVTPGTAFAVQSTTCTANAVLAPAFSNPFTSTCLVRLTYTRPAAAQRPANGTLTLTSDGVGSPQVLQLTGN